MQILKKTVNCRRNGNTLIEVIVAAIILAMTAVVASNLLLFSFFSPKRGAMNYEASFAAKRLREHLKSYVTADTSIKLNAPGSPAWHLPDDSSCADCWALADGTHDVTSMLSPEFRNNYKATMRYTVTRVNHMGRMIPSVDIVVDWSMP